MSRSKGTKTTVMTGRRAVLLGMGSSLLAACAPRDLALPGRSVAQGDRRETQRPSEGGVGGTGIVGILLSETALEVNGLRIEAQEDVILRDALGPRGPEALGLGQALTLEAAETRDCRLRARSIRIVHPLIGPLEGLTPEGFRCLGVDVALEAGAVLRGPGGRPFKPAPGQRVAVSGLWRGAGVVASRIELLPDGDGEVVLAGEIKPGSAPASRRLGGLELRPPAGAAPPPLGSFATAVGRRAGPRFLAERLELGRFAGSAGPLARLSVEGYLEPAPAAPGFAVSGLGHSFDPAARLARIGSGRTLFVGTYDETFRVEHGLALPDDLGARRALLAGLDDGFAPAGALPTR